MRFRLSHLLLLVTLLACLMGYSQWRRRELLRLYAELSKKEVIVEVPDSWVDVLWQRRATAAQILVKEKRGVLGARAGQSLLKDADELKAAGIIELEIIKTDASGDL